MYGVMVLPAAAARAESGHKLPPNDLQALFKNPDSSKFYRVRQD